MITTRFDVEGKGYVTAEVVGNGECTDFEKSKVVFSVHENGQTMKSASIEVDGRDGMNQWYEENVGYRPDDEGKLDISELVKSVAEMFFFHTLGVD